MLFSICTAYIDLSVSALQVAFSRIHLCSKYRMLLVACWVSLAHSGSGATASYLLFDPSGSWTVRTVDATAGYLIFDPS